MLIELSIDAANWSERDLQTWAARACPQVLSFLGYDPAGFEVSILGCDDARIATLNAQFRGKETPTNVLSWPSWDLSAETPGEAPEAPEQGTADAPEALGDMALAYETCAREAADQGKTLENHVLHLIVHSMLHLLGYDHETDEDAELMEKTETLILAELGVADPYKDTGVTT